MINIKKIFRVFRSEESYENFLIQNTELDAENSYSGFRTTFPSLVIVNKQVITKPKVTEKILQLIPEIIEEQDNILAHDLLPNISVNNLSEYDYNLYIGGTAIAAETNNENYSLNLANFSEDESLAHEFGVNWEKTLVLESENFDRFGVTIKLINIDNNVPVWEITNLATEEVYQVIGKEISIDLPHEEVANARPIDFAPEFEEPTPDEPTDEPQQEEPTEEEPEEWGTEEPSQETEQEEWGTEVEIPNDENNNGIPDDEEWGDDYNIEGEEQEPEAEEPEEWGSDENPQEPVEEPEEWGSEEENSDEEWATEGGNPINDDEWG